MSRLRLLVGRPFAAMTPTNSPEAAPAAATDIVEPTDAPEAASASSWSGMAGFRRLGYGLLGLQLVALLIYSVIEFQRYGLTSDYAFYSSAWALAAHGHPTLNFLQSQGEVTLFLLAPFYWLWPHGPILLWMQDLMVVGAELVAFSWICEVVATRETARHAPRRAVRGGPRYLPQVLASAGLVALVANPWIWWTLAFDYHSEAMATLFAVLFARELQKRRKRAGWWALLTLLSGDVGTTYVSAVGLGALVGGRRRLWGGVAVVVGVVWLVVLHALGAMRGTGQLTPLAYLGGAAVAAKPSTGSAGLFHLATQIVRRPGSVLSVIWSKRLNVWANLWSSGLFGILAPVVLFVPVAAITENTLYPGIAFNQPSFQSIPIYIFMPIGTVMFLAWLAKHVRWLAVALAGTVMVSSIGWAVVWLPRTSSQWIRVPPAAAAKLDQFNRALPPNVEVVASQGIVGRFATEHPYGDIVGAGGPVRLHGGPVWFVIAPDLGVETAPSGSEYALVAELAGPLRARPVVVGDGIWSYVYIPPAKQTRFRLPGVPRVLPAWEFHSASGHVILAGPPSGWRVVGSGRKGYLVFGDYWNEPTGAATGTARLSGHGTVYVEVWDVTTNTLLAERRVPLPGGPVEASVPFEVPTPQKAGGVYHGSGPFRLTPVPEPAGDQLEVRVYDLGSGSTPTALSVGMSSGH